MPNLKDMERQSGLLRLLLYLLEGDSYVVKLLHYHDIPNNQLMRSINQLLKLELIVSKPDTSTFPQRKMLSLTEKGKKVARKLREINDMLKQG